VLYDRDGTHYDVICALSIASRGRPTPPFTGPPEWSTDGEDPASSSAACCSPPAWTPGSTPRGRLDRRSCAAVLRTASAFRRKNHLAHAPYLASARCLTARSPSLTPRVGREGGREVPNHLRDDNLAAEGFGTGRATSPAHLPPTTVAHKTSPITLVGRVFYHATSQARGDDQDEILRTGELQIADLLDEAADRRSTPRRDSLLQPRRPRVRDSWTGRLDSGKTEPCSAILRHMNLARWPVTIACSCSGRDDGLL
jgi:hypothetical protein